MAAAVKAGFDVRYSEHLTNLFKKETTLDKRGAVVAHLQDNPLFDCPRGVRVEILEFFGCSCTAGG